MARLFLCLRKLCITLFYENIKLFCVKDIVILDETVKLLCSKKVSSECECKIFSPFYLEGHNIVLDLSNLKNANTRHLIYEQLDTH